MYSQILGDIESLYCIACHWGGLVTIPIAAQATSSHIVHVIRDTKLTTLVIDETHLEYVLRLVEGTSVTHIIVLGEDTDYEEQEKYFGFSITSFSRLQALGKNQLIDRSMTSMESISLKHDMT